MDLAHSIAPGRLKFEALTNVVITSRRQSAILQTISGFCQFAECECQDHSVPIYLVGAERRGVLYRAGWIPFFGRIREVSIPHNVRELCDGCFRECKSLRRVMFGSSASLERIGVSCFQETRVEEVAVPDSVRELCDGWFKGCMWLRLVTFGPSSSLERIGADWIQSMSVEEVAVPDACELCDGCFKGCRSLRRGTFGSSSSLERIGDFCVAGSGLLGS